MASSRRLSVNRAKVINETIDGEVVLINLESGYYYSLDEVGASIWSFVENNATVDEIVAGILQQYEVSPSDAEKAANQLIDELQQEELIVFGHPTGADSGEGRGLRAVATAGEPKRGFATPALRKYTDMQDLLLLDPIHEVDESGWPSRTNETADKRR